MSSKSALVLFDIKHREGLSTLKKIVSELKMITWRIEFSSVYRQFESEQRYDFDASLVVVVRLDFNLETNEFLDRVQNLGQYLKSFGRDVQHAVTVLAVDQQTILSPDLTLPHPCLHTNPLVTRCAAEIWGDYEHPILKMTLNDMARKTLPVENAEFILQGKSLVAN